MEGIEIRKTLVAMITISLSMALGLTLYNAFLLADMADVEKIDLSVDKKKTPPKPIPKKEPMKEFSGHGDAVSDKKDDSTRHTQNKQMVESAPASQMLG